MKNINEIIMNKKILSRGDLLGKNDVLPKYTPVKKIKKFSIPKNIKKEDLYFLL